MSPDGEAIVTGAGDETLRFWNVFSKTRSTKVRRVVVPSHGHTPWVLRAPWHMVTRSLFPGIRVCAQPLHPDPIDPQAGCAAPWGRDGAASMHGPCCPRNPQEASDGREPGRRPQSLIKCLVVSCGASVWDRDTGTLIHRLHPLLAGRQRSQMDTFDLPVTTAQAILDTAEQEARDPIKPPKPSVTWTCGPELICPVQPPQPEHPGRRWRGLRLSL